MNSILGVTNLQWKNLKISITRQKLICLFNGA